MFVVLKMIRLKCTTGNLRHSSLLWEIFALIFISTLSGTVDNFASYDYAPFMKPSHFCATGHYLCEDMLSTNIPKTNSEYSEDNLFTHYFLRWTRYASFLKKKIRVRINK